MSPAQTAGPVNLGQRLAQREAEYAALQQRLRERYGWVENERGELVPPPVQCGSSPRMRAVA